MAMPWQLRNSRRRRPRIPSHGQPSELMRSININELRRVIPRYSNTINEPNVSLKYPDIARLRLSPSCLEITHYFRARTMPPYRMGYDLFRPTSC
jgi:hypothetical protein